MCASAPATFAAAVLVAYHRYGWVESGVGGIVVE